MGLLNDLRFTYRPTPEEKEAEKRATEAANASKDGYGSAEYTQNGKRRVMVTKKASSWNRTHTTWDVEEGE